MRVTGFATVISIVTVLVTLAGAQTAANDEYETLADEVLNNSTFDWVLVKSDRVRMHYQPGSFAEQHRFMILRSLDSAVEEALETLEESRYEGGLRAFYFESREEMERAVGRPVAGFSDWGGNAIYIVLNKDWRSFEVHEFTHVVTMGAWGSPHDSCGWMIEGIANAIDGWCREYMIDEVVLHLLGEEQLPPLGEFFEDSGELGEIRAGFYGASFIRFLSEVYGAETVRELWSQGTGALPELLDASLDAIEDRWKSYVKTKVPSPREIDLEAINDVGCG